MEQNQDKLFNRNRKFSLFVILVLISAMLFSACSNGGNSGNNAGHDQDADNIIVNGSFTQTEKVTADAKESGWTGSLLPTGWIITNTFNSKDYIVEVDKKNSADSDKGSLKIGGEGTVRVLASQSVNGLKPDKKYVLSGWIKTENYKPAGKGVMATGPIIQVVVPENNRLYLTQKITEDEVLNTKDWTRIEVLFTPGSSDARIDCHFNSGSGYVWFDNIKITEFETVEKIGETVVTSNVSNEVFEWGSINGHVYQQDAITTFKNWQYAAYYNKDRYVCLARRKLPDGEWETLVFDDYKQKHDDGHSTISIGICEGDGTIHLSFDQITSQLNYRVSVKNIANEPEKFQWDASNFGDVIHQIDDLKVNRMTYPRFMSAPNGNLVFEHRYSRQLFLHEYDYETGKWTYLGIHVDTTKFSKNTATGAYISNYNFDSKGRLHVTWNWREDAGVEESHDLCYAYSEDNGRTWKNNDGEVVAVTGESHIDLETPGIVVYPIPGLSSYMCEAQNVDNDGRVHVLNHHFDMDEPGDGKTYYYHYYRDDEGEWQRNKIPVTTGSRGKIVFDKNNNAYALLRNFVIAAASAESGWTDWKVVYNEEETRFIQELCVDTYRLTRGDGILSIYTMEKGTNNYLCLDFKFPE